MQLSNRRYDFYSTWIFSMKAYVESNRFLLFKWLLFWLLTCIYKHSNVFILIYTGFHPLLSCDCTQQTECDFCVNFALYIATLLTKDNGSFLPTKLP